MTPENKDVAGLLPSGWKLTHVSDRYVLQKPGEGSAVFDIEDSSVRVAVAAMFFRDLLAAPGAAIAAREQPKVPMAVSVAISAYGDARADDDGTSAARMGECITEIRKALGSVAALASRQEAPVASGEPTDAQIMDCFFKTTAEGQGAYMIDVGRAILALASPSGAGLGGAVASSEAVDSRAAFESTVGSGRVLTRAPNGDYVSPYVQNDWDVWRVACKDRQLTACNFCLGQAAEARAALASQPGSAVEGEKS